MCVRAAADHFDGMVMGSDAETDALEARRARKLRQYNDAKSNLMKQIAQDGQTHMGHEQMDTVTHFADQTMVMSDEVDTSLPFDRVYDSRFDGKREEDHFEDHGMTLAAEADEGNTFDRVFGSAYDGKGAESHFKPGTMSIGPPGMREYSDIRHYPKLTRSDLFPPPRPKFLHGVAANGQPRQMSAMMQGHIDSLVVKKPRSPDGKAAKAARPATTSAAEKAVTFDGGGSIGGGSGGSGAKMARTADEQVSIATLNEALVGPTGRVEDLPTSQKRFAWNSERIAHELVCKFDQFTRRREDHMRKLLWTFGSDPCFESSNKNAIHVSPNNFNRVCDRFGLVCDE